MYINKIVESCNTKSLCFILIYLEYRIFNPPPLVGGANINLTNFIESFMRKEREGKI